MPVTSVGPFLDFAARRWPTLVAALRQDPSLPSSVRSWRDMREWLVTTRRADQIQPLWQCWCGYRRRYVHMHQATARPRHQTRGNGAAAHAGCAGTAAVRTSDDC